jgi:DinB superfamily
VAALTQRERATAVEELEASRDRLLRSLDGLTEEQWRCRPFPDRWSVAECAEHITAAEVPIAKLLAGPSVVEPSEEDRREIRKKDDFVRRFIRDRSRRDEAPERIRPKGRFATREETTRVFQERREANIAYLRETADPLRDCFAPHPFVGVIDGYQWILSLAAHTDRHAAQIEQIVPELGRST